jgi:hypothetical protein
MNFRLEHDSHRTALRKIASCEQEFFHKVDSGNKCLLSFRAVGHWKKRLIYLF